MWIAHAVWLLLPGCAAFHPIHGMPARYLPEEFRGVSRAGEVLGIYIEGVLGDRKPAPPVNIPLNNETPPSFGFPIPVREDGTISLPLVGVIEVRGMTIAEVELRLKDANTKQKQFLNPENDRILVSLQRPRNYRVLVIRQEANNAQQATPGMLNMGTLKRGTGQLVSLPAYKNDVLHAIAQTGGLPGLDAENAIYIIRRRKAEEPWTPLPGTSLPETTPIPAETGAMKFNKHKVVIRAQSGNWSPPMMEQPRGYQTDVMFVSNPPPVAPPQRPVYQPDAGQDPNVPLSAQNITPGYSAPQYAPPVQSQHIPPAGWQTPP